MRWQKVCISHDLNDDELAATFSKPLTKLGIEVFFSNREDSIESIRYEIKDSNCFVPVITENSRKSQWAKQELEIALADYDLGVFPLIEKGQTIEPNRSIKLVTEFDRDNLEDAIYQVISALRGYINRNLPVIFGISVICRKCGHAYMIPLPLQEEIDRMIQENKVYHSECICRTRNNLNPKTFEVLKT